jgi:hypothetical protein
MAATVSVARDVIRRPFEGAVKTGMARLISRLYVYVIFLKTE